MALSRANAEPPLSSFALFTLCSLLDPLPLLPLPVPLRVGGEGFLKLDEDARGFDLIE